MRAAGAPRLLLFNLATDADDPILGFTTWWIRELAEHAVSIDVVTMRTGRVEVPDNVRVYSAGKERGLSEPRRVLEFYRVLRRLLRSQRYDACFAHMMPLFAVMAWPFLASRRIPITLWYAHPSASPILRLAERVATRIVTGSPKSFPLASRKVRAIGSGIDTELFVPPSSTIERNGAFTITYVGRIAPSKRLEMLLVAIRLLVKDGVPDLHVRLVGPRIGAEDDRYEASLRLLVADAKLDDVVTFLGTLPLDALIREYQTADVVANLSPLGYFDKTLLEAWSCGVPAVTTNGAFEYSLADVAPWLLVRDESPEGVARALQEIRGMEPVERRALGERLRSVVVDEHSLKRLAKLLCTEILVGERRRR